VPDVATTSVKLTYIKWVDAVCTNDRAPESEAKKDGSCETETAGFVIYEDTNVVNLVQTRYQIPGGPEPTVENRFVIPTTMIIERRDIIL